VEDDLGGGRSLKRFDAFGGKKQIKNWPHKFGEPKWVDRTVSKRHGGGTIMPGNKHERVRKARSDKGDREKASSKKFKR